MWIRRKDTIKDVFLLKIVIFILYWNNIRYMPILPIVLLCLISVCLHYGLSGNNKASCIVNESRVKRLNVNKLVAYSLF